MSKKNDKGKSKEKSNSYVAQIIIGIISATVVAAFSFNVQHITKDIDKLQESVKELNESVSDLKSDVVKNTTNIDNLNEKVTDIDNDRKITDANHTAIKIDPGDKLVKTTSAFTKKDNVIQNGTTSLRMSDIAGKNAETKKQCTVKEITGKKVLLPYKENGQEVYFLGQLDKNGCWDGNCVINVYSEDQLILITDAKYEHGKIVSYKQVFESNDNRWFISKRKPKKNKNIGETWSYLKHETHIKSFDLNNVKDTDIMTVKKFKKKVKITLDGYYNGQTSGGSYNDSTGNAYLVKYNDDKTVKTLYCGNFENGEFNDATGNAWYISFDEENSVYVYFKGKFRNNNPVESEDNKRRNITNKDIHKKIDKKEFQYKIELHGDNEEIS